MAGNLSPTAQQQVAQYEGFVPRVARLHTLVETFAVARTGHENLQQGIKRAADQLKLSFMTSGLDQMSQLCGSLVMAAGRSGAPGQKTRIMREIVGSLKFQLELAIRTIVREDQELQARKKREAEARE